MIFFHFFLERGRLFWGQLFDLNGRTLRPLHRPCPKNSWPSVIFLTLPTSAG